MRPLLASVVFGIAFPLFAASDPPPAPRTDAAKIVPAFLTAAAGTDAARKALHTDEVRVPENGTLAFDVDFSNLPPRTCWDLPLPVDLKLKRGVEFDFFCSDISQFSSFSFYFKSGNGWYHASFSPEEDGRWVHVKVLKSDCRTEGDPAGWERIEAVRISGWRGGSGRAVCAIAGLVPGGGDSEVLVVVAESMTASDREVAGGSQNFGGRVVATLDALGVEGTLIADTELSADILAKTRAVVLPYNPSFPKDRLPLLKEYLARGGRVLACYSLDSDVADALGVKLRGYRRPADQGAAIGGFLRVGRGLDGQPDYAPQASWMTETVEKDGNVEVVAEWSSADRKALGLPALVRVPSGLYMGHVWLGGSAGAQLGLMRAIVAELAPSLVPKMDSFAREREEELARRRAWLKSLPSKKGEYRACWCHDARGIGGGRDWDASIRFLKENGFNSVLPNLAWAGMAYYRSSVLPVDPSVAREGDAFDACLKACRKYGVKCHVWKVCWNMGYAVDRDFERRMVEAGRVQVSATGEKQTRWLCPSHPDNRRLEIEAMVELAKKGPDGIHFDYIRYPDSRHCFCDGCRKRFEERLGRRVENWPWILLDANAPKELKTAWKDFRSDNVTAVVRGVAERVRRECPGVKLSAAVFRHAESDPYEVGQDWSRWCREGLLDFVCNMDYDDSPAVFASQVRSQMGAVGGAKLYPGIGMSCFKSDGGEAVKLARQIEVVRRLGLDGFTVFNLDAVAERVFPELRTGITRED